MKIMLIFILTLVSTSALATECYRWRNNTNQKVSLTFYFLDGSFQPNGQRQSHIIDAHELYPPTDVNCWGLNTYAFSKVVNGKASWDVDSVVFGTAPGRIYDIN